MSISMHVARIALIAILLIGSVARASDVDDITLFMDDLGAAKTALANGANVNARNGIGRGGTPLIYAAWNDRPEWVRLFLEHNADTTATDDSGATALHYAHDGAVAQMLLDHGANVAARSKSGKTPLIIAIELLRPDVVKVLLDHGASIADTGTKGESTLQIAMSVFYSGSSAAGDDARAKVVSLLLDHGASATATGSDGTALILVAEESNNPVVLSAMLDHGASPEAKGRYYNAILCDAAMRAAPIVKVILDHGAKVDVSCNQFGSTPIFAAHSAATVNVLVAHGANVNSVLTDGETPLMIVSDLEVARAYLANHANKAAVDQKGITALDHAVLSTQCDIAYLLEMPGQTKTLACLRAAAQQAREKENLRSFYGDMEIRAVLLMKSPPVVPEEARKLFVEANTIFKAAQNPEETGASIKMYQDALLTAPWFGDAWYNLSLAQEKLGKFDDAKKSMAYYEKLHAGQKDEQAGLDRQYALDAKSKLADSRALTDNRMERSYAALVNAVGDRKMFRFWVIADKNYVPLSAADASAGRSSAWDSFAAADRVGIGHDGTALGSVAKVTREADQVVLTLGTQRLCFPSSGVSAEYYLNQTIHWTDPRGSTSANDCGSPANPILFTIMTSDGQWGIHGGDGHTSPQNSSTVEVVVEKCPDTTCTKADIAFYWLQP